MIGEGGNVRRFVSEKGSTVTVSGKHGGVFDIDWDWFEEDACIESHPTFNKDFEEPAIVASCDCCPDSPFVVTLKEIRCADTE